MAWPQCDQGAPGGIHPCRGRWPVDAGGKLGLLRAKHRNAFKATGPWAHVCRGSPVRRSGGPAREGGKPRDNRWQHRAHRHRRNTPVRHYLEACARKPRSHRRDLDDRRRSWLDHLDRVHRDEAASAGAPRTGVRGAPLPRAARLTAHVPRWLPRVSPVGGGVWWAVAWWTGPGVITHRQKETIMSDLIAIGYPDRSE